MSAKGPFWSIDKVGVIETVESKCLLAEGVLSSISCCPFRLRSVRNWDGQASSVVVSAHHAEPRWGNVRPFVLLISVNM